MSVKKFPRILNYNNLNFEQIEYYNPQRDKDGSLISTVFYKFMKNNPLSIYLETPKLKTTTGIIKNGDDYFIELELSLEGCNSSFYEFIEKFDEKNIVYSHYNSSEWFNKNLPLKTIEEFYKSPIKIKFDGKNPTMIFKIPTVKGKMLLEVYNQQKQIININKLCAGDEVTAIIKFNGLRFLKQEFIAEWEIYKIKLFKIIDEDILPSGYFFSDDTIDNPMEHQEPTQLSEKENNVFFNLSEEDYHNEEEIRKENESNIINDNILENTTNEPIEEENTTTEPIEEEHTTTEPIEEHNTTNEPIEEEQANTINEPIEEEQANTINEPIEEEQANNTNEPIEEEQANNTNEPLEEEQANNTNEPLEEHNTINEPIEEHNTINEPIEEQEEEEEESDDSENDEYEFTDSEYELDDDDEFDELKLN
jgi:hypothetical protein